MKIKTTIVLCLTILLLVTGCAPKLENGKELVVKLKGDNITIDDLYKQMKNRYAREILVDMIDRAILDKKYPSNDDMVAQINAQIASIKEQTGDGTAFLQAIKSQWGFNSEKEIYDYIELNLKRNKAIEAYIKNNLTDKEIKDYYDTETSGDIKCSHILIKPDTTDSMTAEQKTAKATEALNQAKDIIKKLDNGEKFADLAKKYSDDTSNASNGGDLGWFNKGMMDTNFEKEAYALDKGKHSKEPVKSIYGYHIILKVDTKAKPTLEQAKANIIKTLVDKKLGNDTTIGAKALEQLRKDNKLKIYDSELKRQYDEYMKQLTTK